MKFISYVLPRLVSVLTNLKSRGASLNLLVSLGRELNSLLLSYQESVLPVNYLGEQKASAEVRIRVHSLYLALSKAE